MFSTCSVGWDNGACHTPLLSASWPVAESHMTTQTRVPAPRNLQVRPALGIIQWLASSHDPLAQPASTPDHSTTTPPLLASSALAPATALSIPPSAPVDVLNLCSDSDSDHDDSWRPLGGGAPRNDTAMASHARSQASPSPSPSPQGTARKRPQPVKSKSKSPAKPGDFWRSLGGQRGGTAADASKSRSKDAAAAQGSDFESKRAGPSQMTDSQLPLEQWWTKSYKQQPAVPKTSGGVTDSSCAGRLAGSGSNRNDQLLMPPPSMRGATASAVAAVARQAAAEAAASRAEEGAGGSASVFDHETGSYTVRGGRRSGGGGGGGVSNDDASESVPLAKRLAMLRWVKGAACMQDACSS